MDLTACPADARIRAACLRKNVSIHLTHSANPAFVDRTAWDLALATQSLSYLDSDLAFALSGIYNVQSALTGEAEAFLTGMFTRPPSADQTAYFAALLAYFGDMSFFEPRLLTMYDEALQKIDKALAWIASCGTAGCLLRSSVDQPGSKGRTGGSVAGPTEPDFRQHCPTGGQKVVRHAVLTLCKLVHQTVASTYSILCRSFVD